MLMPRDIPLPLGTCDLLLNKRIWQRWQDWPNYVYIIMNLIVGPVLLESLPFPCWIWRSKLPCREAHMAKNYKQCPTASQQDTEVFSSTAARNWILPTPWVNLKAKPSPGELHMRPPPWPTPWLQPVRPLSRELSKVMLGFLVVIGTLTLNFWLCI